MRQVFFQILSTFTSKTFEFKIYLIRRSFTFFTYVAEALAKQIGALAGQDDFEQLRIFFSTFTSGSFSSAFATFRFVTCRADFFDAILVYVYICL